MMRMKLTRSLWSAMTLVFIASCASGDNGSRGAGEVGSGGASSSSGPDSGTLDDAPTSGGGNGTSGGGEDDPPAVECTALAVEVQDIFTRNCAGCHGPDSNGAGGMNYVTDLVALGLKKKVVPFDAEGSPLFGRVEREEMPPPGTEPRPTPSEIDTIRQWIQSGACSDGGNVSCQNPAVTFDAMVDSMQQDLLAIDSDDQPFIRYLTLTHLYTAGVCESELEQYRQAVSKLVNSLSRAPSIEPPVAIGPGGTILRINMQDYLWAELTDEQGLPFDPWEASAFANPYATRFVGDKAEFLKDQTSTEVPFQPFEGFLQVVTRAPLYHDILELPGTAQELRQELGIDAAKNFDDDKLMRSGFELSGVSAFNRMFERHENPSSGFGYYYESFDFSGNDDQSNIFKFPLAFKPAGGEIIFSLPNGLQAYLLADANGTRLDAAPVNIVKDWNQEDRTVRTAISCIACHDMGILPKADEVSAFVMANKALFPDLLAREKVAKLHDPGFVTVQKADAKVFAGALEEAGVDTKAAEPIIRASLAHEADVGLKRAAAEFGVDPVFLQKNLVRLDISLQRLFDDGGTVSRDVFSEHFQESMCLLLPGDKVEPDCLAPK